jgi:3-deoxy-7-phosphoheptulonate synthase
MATVWSPTSWRDFPAEQQPDWPDRAELARVVDELRGYPPLVFAGEARQLHDSLAAASAGRAFVLQAGDCAESFLDFSAIPIRERLRVILQMSVILTYASGLPVVKVGRIAGQFSKPRSSAVERWGELELPSFRGHIVHAEGRTAEERLPAPERLLKAYHHSTGTLNIVRAFTKGGYADMRRVHAWNQEFVTESPEGRRYESLASEIERALDFMTACGFDIESEPRLHEVDLYTSHEALLLPYEEALTRRDSLTGEWYDCSAHMVWLGYRTSQLDGAHVEFLSGVRNPLGVKVGPGTAVDDLLALCERLDPERTPGRLTLIARLGADGVEVLLPPLVEAVRDAEHPVVWICDPMHANTETTAAGTKTRRFDAILGEIEGFFGVHRGLGTWPGGVHLEITGDDVTECLGGSVAVLEEQLDVNYTTLCDPRLNARQALDVAFRIAELMKSR